MTTMHFFGNVCCRGDERKLSGTVDSALIDTAFSVRDNEEECELFIESLFKDDKMDYDTQTLLAGIASPPFMEGTEFEDWTNKKSFVIIMEECEFAVGSTLRNAKVAWAEIE